LQIGNSGFQIAEMHFTISNELRNLKSRKSPNRNMKSAIIRNLKSI